MSYKRISAAVPWIVAACLSANAVLAEPAAPPAVVELFTSQGCYSCPPAEKLLGELAGRPDVVALEFHVDYWNSLVYGSAGKWRDPFSKPAHTERQRAYNLAIRRRSGVYTPQIIVGGRLQMVGSKRDRVLAAIRRIRSDGPSPLTVSIRRSGDRLGVSVQGAAKTEGTVWLVKFLIEETTRVTAGENKDKSLTNRNVVTGIRRIGPLQKASLMEFRGAALKQGEGCAVLIHKGDNGPILGAAYCPKAAS